MRAYESSKRQFHLVRVPKPIVWFVRKHPAVLVAIGSAYLYLISLVYLSGFLGFLGAESAWFDVPLTRLVSFSWPGMLVGAALVSLITGLAAYVPLVASRWGVLVYSSILAIASFCATALLFGLDHKFGIYELSKVEWILSVCSSLVSTGLVFAVKKTTTRDAEKFKRCIRLRALVERLNSIPLRSDRKSRHLEMANSEVSHLERTNGNHRSGGILDLFWGVAVICFALPCFGAWWAGKVASQLKCIGPGSSYLLAADKSVIMFSDGKSAVMMSRGESGREIVYRQMRGGEVVELPYGDINNDRWSKYRGLRAEWASRVDEISKESKMSSEELRSRRNAVDLYSDVCFEYWNHGELSGDRLSTMQRRYVDGWGNQFVVKVLNQRPMSFVVVSAGLDGLWNTSDDIQEPVARK